MRTPYSRSITLRAPRQLVFFKDKLQVLPSVFRSVWMRSDCNGFHGSLAIAGQLATTTQVKRVPVRKREKEFALGFVVEFKKQNIVVAP
jgi:hypothetical protein